MNTYRVDFTPEGLRRDKNARTRLLRDVKKAAKILKKDLDQPPSYVWKRRTDRSLGYWFQFSTDVMRDKKAADLLKPYGWTPAAPPVLPQSEWRRL